MGPGCCFYIHRVKFGRSGEKKICIEWPVYPSFLAHTRLLQTRDKGSSREKKISYESWTKILLLKKKWFPFLPFLSLNFQLCVPLAHHYKYQQTPLVPRCPSLLPSLQGTLQKAFPTEVLAVCYSCSAGGYDSCCGANHGNERAPPLLQHPVNLVNFSSW